MSISFHPRTLALRLPLLKAVVITCLARVLLKDLESASLCQWETLLGHLAFLAPLSEEARFRKKVGSEPNYFSSAEVIFRPGRLTCLPDLLCC